VFILTSCGWHEAKEVIATADNLDQTEHLIYDDTAALGKSIRCLDNPFGRVLMSNTLGKAYYYMGRNLDDKYGLINQAAECYIMADRLQINDPIYRGRVNSCMGYICAQNNSDSLALIFYERSSKHFEKSDNEWRFAQSLLNISRQYIELHLFDKADSILHIAQMYQLDSAYQARYLETKGLFFYEQEQYDYALTHFQDALNYWKDNETKCFCYVKIMQTYFSIDNVEQTLFYAQRVVNSSNNPNHLVNAYYCLLQDAKNRNNAQLLSYYSHARTDAQKALRNAMIEDAKALPILAEYLENPHPLRGIRMTLFLSIILCAILAISIAMYRKSATYRLQKANRTIDDLSMCIKQQQYAQNQPTAAHYFEKGIAAIRTKYPTPYNKWNDYNILKKDIEPWLHNWVKKLDQLKLTDREKIYCIFVILYPHLPSAKLADYMNYDKNGIRVFKSRIAQKLGIKSSELLAFLQKLSLKH
jgi:tetratricopeptide (TPR) repeat protein